MAYPEYQNRVQELVKLYRHNPHLFNDEQLDELQQIADEQGVKFSPKRDEFNLRRNASQLQSGFIEGFTTLPVGKEPKSTYEAIAHSLGHLAGFAPGILAAPVKKVLGKSAGAAVRAIGEKSVPMFFGGIAQRGLEKGLTKTGLEAATFMQRGAAGRNILESGVHLGVASTVSSIWKGQDEMINAGVFGAVAGGAFGGIGNFVRLNNMMKNGSPDQVRRAENALKASLGAAFQTTPSLMHNEPIEMILYNTLLGGFFGYKSQPAFKQQGTKFLGELRNELIPDTYFRPDLHKDWSKYNAKTKDFILNSDHGINNMARKVVARRSATNIDPEMMNEYIIGRASAKFNTNNPTNEQINTVYREEAHKIYRGESYGFEVIKTGEEIGLETKEDLSDPSTIDAEVTGPQSKYKMNNVGVLRINSETGQVTYESRSGDFNGQKIGEKNVNRPADNLENPVEPYETFSVVQKMLTNKDGGIIKNKNGDALVKNVKPLQSNIDFTKNKLMPEVSARDFC